MQYLFHEFTKNYDNRGRPKDVNLALAFKKLCSLIDESHECQLSLQVSLKEIQTHLSDESSVFEKIFKPKLFCRYGDNKLF